MDWQEHIRQVAVNWLSKGDDGLSLEPEMLMLFGNPDLFQEDQFTAIFEGIESSGVFFRGRFKGNPLTFCRPLFGAPIVAMYTEVAALLGVKKIIACGYVGGVAEDLGVGSYLVPSSANGLDGCTRSYSPNNGLARSSESLMSKLCGNLDRCSATYSVGPIVSIDTLMLENDVMVESFARDGYYAIDLETACLYAVANRSGVQAASIHIVSDSPRHKDIDEQLRHEASFVEQIEIATRALLD